MDRKLCTSHGAIHAAIRNDLNSFAKKAAKLHARRPELANGPVMRGYLQGVADAKEDIKELYGLISQCADCQGLRGEAAPDEEQNGETDGARESST